MRYGTATEVVTYKCEGCGVRKPVGTEARLTHVPAWFPGATPHMVCSEQCFQHAREVYARQCLGRLASAFGPTKP